jgi:hypothetical protein
MPKSLLYGLLATAPQLKKLFMLQTVKSAVIYSYASIIATIIPNAERDIVATESLFILSSLLLCWVDSMDCWQHKQAWKLMG